MRAVCFMLALLAAPLVAGTVEAGAPAAGPAQVDAPARSGPHAAKGKGKGGGKGSGSGDAPGTVPGTGPRSGKPPRPVMARRPTRAAANARARSGSSARQRSGPLAPSAQLVRSGFRVTATGSEVVLQTSAEVDLETRGTKKAPAFVLKRCRALHANDRRPLDTRYFATSVTSVALRQHGSDLVVQVTLREAATTSTRKEQGPGDAWSWILAFGAPAEGDRPADPAAPVRSSAPTATAAMTR